MTRKQKQILMVSGCIAALLVLVIVTLVQFIDINVYKPRIEAVASDALGMDFRIGGKMRIVLFPRFGVSLENVSIRKGEADFLSARKIRIGLQLLALLKREVRIRKFAFIDPCSMAWLSIVFSRKSKKARASPLLMRELFSLQALSAPS